MSRAIFRASSNRSSSSPSSSSGSEGINRYINCCNASSTRCSRPAIYGSTEEMVVCRSRGGGVVLLCDDDAQFGNVQWADVFVVCSL